jgi:hypothetical protein
LKNYSVKLYKEDYFNQWNNFVAKAKNATFLFHRDFMEYHKDRFEDYSLLVFDAKENLQAILPGNRVDDTVFSHQGLTYGGLVLSSESTLSEVIFMTQALLSFLKCNEVEKLQLKLLPNLYPSLPSDEMEYILFLLKAKLIRRDSIAVLDLENKPKLSRVRKRGINKGIENGIVIKEESSFDAFWKEILIPNLKERYNVAPVHSLEEITYLKRKFPKKIRQFNAYYEDKIVAGVTVFDKGNVVHPQYISGNKAINNALGSLDYLYSFLIEEIYPKMKYFDFGISNENQGKNLNEQLHYWKESFGARTMKQDFYEIETKNYLLLDTVLL